MDVNLSRKKVILMLQNIYAITKTFLEKNRHGSTRYQFSTSFYVLTSDDPIFGFFHNGVGNASNAIVSSYIPGWVLEVYYSAYFVFCIKR